MLVGSTKDLKPDSLICVRRIYRSKGVGQATRYDVYATPK